MHHYERATPPSSVHCVRACAAHLCVCVPGCKLCMPGCKQQKHTLSMHDVCCMHGMARHSRAVRPAASLRATQAVQLSQLFFGGRTTAHRRLGAASSQRTQCRPLGDHKRTRNTSTQTHARQCAPVRPTATGAHRSLWLFTVASAPRSSQQSSSVIAAAAATAPTTAALRWINEIAHSLRRCLNN